MTADARWRRAAVQVLFVALVTMAASVMVAVRARGHHHDIQALLVIFGLTSPAWPTPWAGVGGSRRHPDRDEHSLVAGLTLRPRLVKSRPRCILSART